MATGLRERKKQATREQIGRVAVRLFAKRGFDAVTVAEVAEAAGVSEKTVFNYFPAKEDLVWPHGEERISALIDAIQGLPADGSVVDPFREATHQFLDRVAGGDVEEILARPRLVMQSQALRSRLSSWWEQESALLAPVVAARAGYPDGHVVPAVVARTLAWTHRITFRTALTRLMDGVDPKRVARDLRKQADEAYDLLEAGLGAYGRD